ncbi:MAG: S9 family peptidase [Alphaproteobacteria bacterium]|nr:S9 family peptidase [Alphaproteobacteria bacterium]MDE2113065.1 S9 family peptidase [Alphaproteobacteria bacterium]MDE2493768.1 S9 family peptidase [Alphaproteobacteria bacterium]
MKSVLYRSVLAVVCAWSFSFCATADGTVPHPPVEAFGSLPMISQPRLSPDGTHLAALQSYKGRPAVVIYDLGAPRGTMPAILTDDTHIIVGIHWASNDRLLANIYDAASYDFGAKAMPFVRTFSVDTKAQNPVLLLKNSAWIDRNNSSAAVADYDLSDPDQVIMPLWAGQSENEIGGGGVLLATQFINTLYKVDVTTGNAEQMMAGDKYTRDWIMDGHGHVVARVDQTQQPLIDHLQLNDNGNWREIAAYDASADKGADVAGLIGDGTELVRFAVDKTTGVNGLVEVNIATAKTKPLFFDPTYDVSELQADDWTRRIIGASYTADTEQTRYFDPGMEALQRGIDAAFPGLNAQAVSWDIARNKVVVAASGPQHPTAYYLLDRVTHRASKFGDTYPKLQPSDLGEEKPYPYKARDGLEIPAYLTLPPGKTPKNLPTVILPHGGPDARDSLRFDWLAQFLANRGYAVLQPNYRGSKGYGMKFTDAGLHQWGLKMQDDITDGVKKLIADGIADPKRICIVGGSYGGYAALAGAIFTPDLYACAVSYAGVSDLPKILATTENEHRAYSKAMSFWISRIGNTDADLPRLKATSPALHADQDKCPILLMHGADDWTVRIDQSEEMYDALTRAGKNATFLRFEGTDHYLETADARIQMLTETEKFLAKYIGK